MTLVLGPIEPSRLENQSILFSAMERGDYDNVLELILIYHKTMWHSNIHFRFSFYTQDILQRIMNGNNHDANDGVATIKHMRHVMQDMMKDKEKRNEIENIALLVMLENPKESCMGYLLEKNEREKGQQRIHQMILQANGLETGTN